MALSKRHSPWGPFGATESARDFSYRTRLACLGQPGHTAIWQDQPPLIFTAKVILARAATDTLADTAARQSAATTGTAADKRREEKELENTAYSLARAFVACCTDGGDLTLAAKYDMPISSWRTLRDEALLQRAQLLHTDATALSAGPAAATALLYGITPGSIAALKKETDDYAAFIAAPQDTIAGRSALTRQTAGGAPAQPVPECAESRRL